MRQRLIVGMSGASGAIYGIRLLEALRDDTSIETHLILTKPAERTIVEETDRQPAAVRAIADYVHAPGDIGAPLASGSFATMGMVIVPCSIRTVSAVAYCQADNLLTRAADVTLKEGRKLILVVREAPLHRGHLKAMLEAAENGATIVPPVPAFYTRPQSVSDIVDHTVARILDQLGIANELSARWGETAKEEVDG
ncbi:MAG TPA: UbiX family flavin prenyltransferase [Candidatus Polarisedimenticolaceae bacterium]|nr:UbiX family flavin prenyltransferase [Candidatus Polarisedimenticolaceae bacterium]